MVDRPTRSQHRQATADRAQGSTTPAEPGDTPAPAGAPALMLDGVTRTFGTKTAVQDLSLTVQEGELLTLLGPSGCGKTTTLRLIAGLERPDAGTIRVHGDVVTGEGTFVQPDERDIGLIFQDFALFPHLSVGENIAYGIQDRPADAIDQRVTDLLELVNLTGYRDQTPDSLSGGQRQRVALARSLAPEPEVLLLDEPFSNLDVALRQEMREEVRAILNETGVTAISVTHDQEEALSISDRVAVIDDGRLEQVGSPEAVFQRPTSRFVAEFLGDTGFVTGTVSNDQLTTPIESLGVEHLDTDPGEPLPTAIEVLVRPDDIKAIPTDPASANGRIVHRQYTGPSFVYRVELETGDIVHCHHNHVDRFAIDDPVRIELTTDHPLAWFPGT